jgi:hypothetical protein
MLGQSEIRVEVYKHLRCRRNILLIFLISLIQLAVPGSDSGGQSLNVLSRSLFVSLYNLSYDIMGSEYAVNKMQVGFHLRLDKVFPKQNKTTQMTVNYSGAMNNRRK